MRSYNNVTLIGRVVRGCDFKDLTTTQRSTFTLTVDRPYKDSDGEHPADFLQIIAWGKLAEICKDYLKKGNLVLVNGRIQSRSYEGDNETKWITEIVADAVNILEYKEKKTEQ